jgi:hypothetical protein
MQPFVPTRLIMLDVSIADHVRLVSPTELVPYIALSYCWGSSEQNKTLNSNVKDRERQITIADLPRTLQDAISMTQALDIQYLWIDALCIIQDDEHDWAVESSRMADIYSNAWLVLAATRAPDCASGILQARDETLVIAPNELPEMTATISARRVTTHDSWGEVVLNGQPLCRRAWVIRSPSTMNTRTPSIHHPRIASTFCVCLLI